MQMPNEQKVETRLPSTPILANPLLYVRPFSSVIYNVGLCRTAECFLCVGTRQALLQGWLLCVGFVFLENGSDLVCQLFFTINDFFYFVFRNFLAWKIKPIYIFRFTILNSLKLKSEKLPLT